MQHLFRIYYKLPLILRLLGTVLTFMIFFGVVIHLIEPDAFPTIFDGIWWAFITGATVGYGDYVPLTPAGKITAIILILTGGGLVTFYMATLSAAQVKHKKSFSKGEIEYKGRNHFIIIGWNERTRQLIDMINQENLQEKIVLIDRTMNQLYQQLPHVHFIKGEAINEETLEKAKVRDAKMAVVTSDPSKKELQSDQSVIHQIVSLKGHHPELFIIAEVLTERQRVNAERAGANTVIRSNDFMSSLFYHELFRNDPVQPFELLLDLLTARQFHEERVPNNLVGHPIVQSLEYFLDKRWQVIGIRKGKTLSFDLHADITLEEGDYLIVLSPLRS